MPSVLISTMTRPPCEEEVDNDTIMKHLPPPEAWKAFPKDKIPFLAIPPEIHLRIFSFLNPVDAVCLSLVNTYIYSLTPPSFIQFPLLIGSPDSAYPVPELEGCKHCTPVLYYPAHCELHFHLREFIPKHLNFCSACGKYTRCEAKGFSDSHEICGNCGIPYRRRYERGRRMLDMLRPGEKQERLCKWYNDASAI